MTPEQWRDRLLGKLDSRQGDVTKYRAYYDGNHPLPEGPKKETEKFRRLQKAARANWMGLIVDAVAERMHIVGFRFGDNQAADADAWEIWQANQLDADHKLVDLDALTLGSSYALVWPDPEHSARVRITAEHPSQCVVAYEPGDRRKRAAGLKRWVEQDGTYCTLYLPGLVYKWYAPAGAPVHAKAAPAVENGVTLTTTGSVRWEERVVPGESWPLEISLDRVPLIELRPRPKWDGCGRSELDGLTDIQDRTNHTTFNQMVAAEYSAFRQKWATGLDIPEDEEGNPVEPFEAAVNRLWASENPDTKFGEFSQTDLTNYVKAREADINTLAAVSRTPPQYLLGAMVNVSGDALKAAESGLTSKVRDRQTYLGEDWEEVLRTAFAARGDSDRAAEVSAEVIWKDPEIRSEGELVDALVKMRTLGVPVAELWRRWGATPQEIERWKIESVEDALNAALAVQPAGLPTDGV